MRLLMLATGNPTYLQEMYGTHPNLAMQSFEGQHEALVRDASVWVGHWADALSSRGFEVWTSIPNAQPLQLAWARSQRLHVSERSWYEEVIVAQAKAFQPTVAFLSDYAGFQAGLLLRLRREVPSIRLIVGWCGAASADLEALRTYDVVLTCIPEMENELAKRGVNIHHMHHAFDGRVSTQIGRPSRRIGAVVFSGSLVLSEGAHLSRTRLLLEVAARVPLVLHLQVPSVSMQRKLIVRTQQLAYDAVRWLLENTHVRRSAIERLPQISKPLSWPRRPALPPRPDRRLADQSKEPVFGMQMYRTLASHLITLNTHADASARNASNKRLFEATGIGTCVLTDWRDDLHTLFEPGREVETYRTPDECASKAQLLLAHPNVADEIARAGQARTLRDHTFEKRAAQLDALIEDCLLRDRR